MKVYFATHSASTDNETGLASGCNNPELSETGIKQARELGETFKDTGIDLACSSDLVRAVETVFMAFGEYFPLIMDRRLREINYGDFNGKPRWNAIAIKEHKERIVPFRGCLDGQNEQRGHNQQYNKQLLFHLNSSSGINILPE